MKYSMTSSSDIIRHQHLRWGMIEFTVSALHLIRRVSVGVKYNHTQINSVFKYHRDTSHITIKEGVQSDKQLSTTHRVKYTVYRETLTSTYTALAERR